MAADSRLPGIKFNKRKLRFELIPFEILEQLAAVLTCGAMKYEVDNWKTIPNPLQEDFGSMMRHLNEWRQGREIDEDTGIHHATCALAQLVFMIYELHRRQRLPAHDWAKWEAMGDKYSKEREEAKAKVLREHQEEELKRKYPPNKVVHVDSNQDLINKTKDFYQMLNEVSRHGSNPRAG